jgi:hypothetical protein
MIECFLRRHAIDQMPTLVEVSGENTDKYVWLPVAFVRHP